MSRFSELKAIGTALHRFSNSPITRDQVPSTRGGAPRAPIGGEMEMIPSATSSAISISSSQKGWITEGLVAMAMILHSGGRLAPYSPAADDHGIDLLVYDKQTARTVALQVKAWTSQPDKAGTIQFDTRKATFQVWPNLFSVMVYVPFPSTVIEQVWLIPSEDIPTVAHSYKSKYALTCSIKPESKDKASAYRCSPDVFIERILNRIECQ